MTQECGSGQTYNLADDGSGSGTMVDSAAVVKILNHIAINVKVSGSSRILGGQNAGTCFGSNIWNASNPSVNITIESSASVYNIGESSLIISPGNPNWSAVFNTTGYCYSSGYYIFENDYSTSNKFTVTKGHFVSRFNSSMFKTNGSAVTNAYCGTADSSSTKRNFSYMNNYNSTSTVQFSNCYYYTKGV